VHVIRCVVYCADLLVWACLVYLLLLAEFWLNHVPGRWRLTFQPLWGVAALALLVIFNYRLAQAYLRYLRFRHVAATLAAAQVIAALVVWKLLMVMQGY
jgi:hypothetical protein